MPVLASLVDDVAGLPQGTTQDLPYRSFEVKRGGHEIGILVLVGLPTSYATNGAFTGPFLNDFFAKPQPIRTNNFTVGSVTLRCGTAAGSDGYYTCAWLKSDILFLAKAKTAASSQGLAADYLGHS